MFLILCYLLQLHVGLHTFTGPIDADQYYFKVRHSVEHIIVDGPKVPIHFAQRDNTSHGPVVHFSTYVARVPHTLRVESLELWRRDKSEDKLIHTFHRKQTLFTGESWIINVEFTPLDLVWP